MQVGLADGSNLLRDRGRGRGRGRGGGRRGRGEDKVGVGRGRIRKKANRIINIMSEEKVKIRRKIERYDLLT